MASKSKKRRRVFRASCILAALIIAGSSFAWFTSKDEVTNRLTANSDYGVSIVESFVPPKNWLPGQEINKDVYAVNTGNIEAFVKEDLTGVLDYTFEYLVENFETTCVTLDDKARVAIDGATTDEAGSFLAWTNAAGVELGYVNSARYKDVENGEVTGAWHPTVAGDYIFRRSIGTKHVEADPENNIEEHDETVYTYAGYHFEPNGEGIEDDKYYKIVIGTDPFRAAETYAADDKDDADGSTRFVFDVSVDSAHLGATIGDDGVITTNPTIHYVQVEHVAATEVSFKYHEGTEGEDNKYDGAPYLAVRYSNVSGDLSAKSKAIQAAEKALADAQKALADAEVQYGPYTDAVADAEVAYYNALYDYYTAKSRYDKTKADFDYANDLIDATNDLYPEAYKRHQAEEKKAELLEALQTAMTNLKDEITHEYNEEDDDAFTTFQEIVTAMTSTAATKIDSLTLVPGPATQEGTVRYEIANATDNGGTALTNVEQNVSALDTIWARIAGTAGDGSGGILNDINTDYTNLSNKADIAPNGDKTHDVDPDVLEKNVENSTAYYQKLVADLDKLEQLLIAYADTYTAFVTSYNNEATQTNLALDAISNENTNLNKIRAFYKETESVGSGSVQTLEDRVKLATDVEDENTDTGLKGRIDDYREKYRAYYDYMAKPYADGVNQATSYYWAVDNWDKAVSDYNTAVGTAKNKYDTAISAVQDTRNAAADDVTITDDSGKLTLVNDGQTLVNGYSAHSLSTISNVTDNDDNFATSNADPKIYKTDTVDDTVYTKYLSTNDDDETIQTPAVPNVVDTAFEQLGADPGSTKQKLSALASTLGKEAVPAGEGGNPAAVEATGKVLVRDQTKEAYDAAKADSNYIAANTALTQKRADVAAAQTALARANNASVPQGTSNIDIDVVLDKNVVKSNADDITTNPTWVFDVTTDQTTNPTFYYNRIVGPAETTNKLVDKLVFCDTVTSKDYVDLTFDLNVGMDSAQAIYENATSKTIKTDAVDANDAFAMDAAVAADNQKVTWTRTAGGTGTGGETPATTLVDVFVADVDALHNLIKMVKTGTGDSATWAVADSGSTITDAVPGHHYTINGFGDYTTVAELTAALNDVTGDDAPVVAYVTD